MYQLTISGKSLPIAKRGDLEKLSHLELVLGYNALTGKSIKKFHTKKQGEDKVWALLTESSTNQPKEDSQPKGGEDMAAKPKNRKKVKSVHGKAKKPKSTGDGTRGRKPIIPGTHIIKVLVKNPKRNGSMAHTKFSLFRDGMTVDQYRKLEGKHPDFDAGWTNSEIRWDLKRKLIKVEKA